MSASLVGSEMCIRDRPSPPQGPPQTSASGARRGGQAEVRSRQRVRQHPVSYTHLTLPTICSV
eukprot:12367209-Alexandrium_andersonii.AAC.1